MGRGLAFQSKLPAWGVTIRGVRALKNEFLFRSPLPAWGETQRQYQHQPADGISIHSPRMGRDRRRAVTTTPPTISIHSPRMGRDILGIFALANFRNFNPLSPHGERPERVAAERAAAEFQSTLPAWGETLYYTIFPHPDRISIHSPRMGRDIFVINCAYCG